MKNSEINIRDPFVLVWDGGYYLYGTRGAVCWEPEDAESPTRAREEYGFDVYIGTDLENWEGPFEVFCNNGDFWADRNYWAPEVHYYQGAFYMFASFKSKQRRRGTQILKSAAPTGPFIPLGEQPVTPEQWECLDGTLYIEGDQPYMVFCHEHRQVIDGEMNLLPLNHDLSVAGKPELLFRASQSPYVEPLENGHYITDGPFMYRCKDGTLLMIWSSFGKAGYLQAVARSVSGSIRGPWVHDEEPLFQKDGGHGMIFKGLDGRLYLALHAPNTTLRERPVFFGVREVAGRLRQ